MKRVAILACVSCILLGIPAQSQEKVRVEKDLLGEKVIPAEAYYGVQTARALENFQISGVRINHYPGFVEAWAIVKLAAARANTDVGAMKPATLQLIEKACQAVLEGKYKDQFQVSSDSIASYAPPHRYNQTRSRESNWSLSTGFAI